MLKDFSMQPTTKNEPAARTPSRQQQIVLMILVVLLLASFGLRVWRLGNKSIWWDEGLAAWAARQPLADIARWTAADVHPPLYFWMLHFWRIGSGDSEFGLRLLSAMIGVLTVAATYLLGRKVAGHKVGLLAALLVSLSRFDVWWSQEARMYILAALWAPLALWAAIRFWDRQRTLDAALYVFFTVAGLYTLYLSVSVMVVANLAWLWILWRAEHRLRALLRWAAAQIVVLILYAPWLLYALGRIPTWSSASPVAVDVFLRIYWTVLTTGIPVSVETYRWLTLPVLALFLTGLLALVWKNRCNWRTGRNVSLFLLGLLLPAAVVYLVSLPKETFFYSPQLAPRYLLIFAPAFYVLLGWGIVSLSENRSWLVPAALMAIALTAAGYGLWQYYPGRILLDDYKSLEATLRAYQRTTDAVVLYTDKDWPVFAYHHPGRWWGIPHGQSMTPQAAENYLAPLWREHEGVWLVVTPYAPVNDPAGEIPAWLAARAQRTEEYRFDDKMLRFYARTETRAETARQPAPGLQPPNRLDLTVGRGLRLAGYELPVQEVQSGDPICLFLYWASEPIGTRPPTGLEVSLMGDGSKSWQRVNVPAPDLSGEDPLVRQQVDLIVPPNVPDGVYAFTVRAESDDLSVDFGRVSVRYRERAVFTAADVTISHRLQTDFADGVRLLGYNLEKARVAPGETLFLTLYWQAREPVEHRYKVFTHLLGEVFNAESNNFLWGQQDNEPVSGSRLTTTWQIDEVIVDSYAIPVSLQAPAGSYTIEIGLYDPATGLRLPVLDDQGQMAADHLLLTQVSVENP